MKYIRTKDGIYKYVKKIRNYYFECDNFIDDEKKVHCFIIFKPKDILKQADTIEDLIQIGDIVFYWQQSDDKEHCSLMVYDSDIRGMKYNAITKLLIPAGEDYKCASKGYPSFNLIKDRRYLVNKGELELL